MDKATKQLKQNANKHGGIRLGSGRRVVSDFDRKKQRGIQMTDAQAAKATNIGNGNISFGVRKAIDRYEETP